MMLSPLHKDQRADSWMTQETVLLNSQSEQAVSPGKSILLLSEYRVFTCVRVAVVTLGEYANSQFARLL